MRDFATDGRLSTAIVVLGLSAIVTQTILLREFLTVFSGNELVIGIVLANWMVLTGAGSFLGRYTEKTRDKPHVVILLFVLIALLPALTVLLLYGLRNIIFPVGAMIGVVECFIGSFFLLLPYCLISGVLFTLFAMLISERSQSNRIAAVYSLESAGSLIGGLLFNVVLVFFFSTFQSLLLLALVDLGACCALSMAFVKRSFQILTVSLGAILMLMVARVDLDTVANHWLFRNQDLILHRNTPYGNLVITRTGEQLNFYENSSLLFVTNDQTTNEDAVHYAMVQHPNPRRVLLIGGGISGTTDEILKYNVEKVDYVEINPAIIDIGREHTSSLNDPRITAFSGDGRRFVKNSSAHYDVVLVNVPDPSTAQLNRYYTAQFLQQLRAILAPNGVVALGLLPSDDYSGTEARQLSSVLYHTLQARFKNVLVIPGIRNHYLASDGALTTHIADAIASRKINNAYVNQYYIDDLLLAQRSETFKRALNDEHVMNEDFVPIAYYRQVQYWLSLFGIPAWIPGMLLGLAILVIAGRLNAVSFGMFTGGFAASAIEVVLLISFQIIYGYVYQAIGIVIAVFMAGLAGGSYFGQRPARGSDLTRFVRIQAGMGLYAVLLPLILSVLKEMKTGDLIIQLFFVILTLFIGFMVGWEFSLGTRLLKGRISQVASLLYSVDLIGAAIGALMISIYLIPLFGIAQSCTIVAIVSLIGSVVALFRGERNQNALAGVGSYV